MSTVTVPRPCLPGFIPCMWLSLYFPSHMLVFRTPVNPAQASTRSYAQLQPTIYDFQRSSLKDSIPARAAVVQSLARCRELHAAASELKALIADWHAAGRQPEGNISMADGGAPDPSRPLMGACHAVVHAAERAGERVLLESVLDHMQQVRTSSIMAAEQAAGVIKHVESGSLCQCHSKQPCLCTSSGHFSLHAQVRLCGQSSCMAGSQLIAIANFLPWIAVPHSHLQAIKQH